MNQKVPESQVNEKEFICHCSGTSRARIVELIDDGLGDLDIIARKTGASAGCGACEMEIVALLDEYTLVKNFQR